MSNTLLSALRTLRLALLPILVVGACATPVFAKESPSSVRMPAVQAACSWDRPGVDPFMGDVVGAVDRYTDIPLDVRQRLKERMAKREYDDLVSIQRDRIVGDRGQDYNATIRDMHFGAGSVCHTVSRDHWTPAMQERGLVYCERNHCILVPTVCRNVSRIARRGVSPEHAEGPDEVFAAVPPPAVGPGAAAAGPGAPLATDGAQTFAQAAGAGLGEGAAGSAEGGSGQGGAAGAGGGGAGGGGGIGGAPLANQEATTTPGGIQVGTPVDSGTPGSSTPVVTPAVPEPSTWGLLVAGLVLTLGAGQRRRARRAGPAPQAASSGRK